MRTLEIATLWTPATTIACLGLLLGGHVSSGWAQAPSPPRETPATRDPVEAFLLDNILQRPAAARLLAAMEPNTPIDTKVSRLIDRLVLRDRDQVQAAATALIMLGPPAVPSIIRRMDDRRDMPVRMASFENRSPAAFEGVTHLEFSKVIDCLDVILGTLTGEPIGIMADSGQAPGNARDKSVAAWKAYLARMKPFAPGKSMPIAVPAVKSRK